MQIKQFGKKVNNQTQTLTVDLGDRSYPIYIGSGLLKNNLWHKHIAGQQVFIVTNQTVAPIYLEALKRNLKAFECNQIILPDGEEYKTLASLGLIFDALIESRHRRNTTVIALGGGVIGDLAGFAAACYQRGVPIIQIPTTLLAQVDASVGGKTAVNHPLGKNMIGAFHQPNAVIIDIDTLQSLPEREFRSALSEIIKAALIADENFFNWLEVNMQKILVKDMASLTYAIKKACTIKINIVIADEKEANIRAWLNLGHTFGHAIEQSFGYGEWTHGEAVALGLIMAADYSCRVGWLDKSILLRIKNILTMAELPIRLPNSISPDQIIESMNSDKKKDTQHLKLVLLKGIGHAALCSSVDQKLLEAAIMENRI